MKHRNDNMLLRIAQADAFAAAVEYVKRDEHAELYEAIERFDSYQQHPTHRKLRPGMYTDDTQMSIAVAEVLLREAAGRYDGWPTILRTPFVWVDAFFAAFERDKRDGYSRGFQKLLESATDSEHLQGLIVPDSNKNGAAMRAVPLGVIKDPVDVVSAAMHQASVTHNTYGGLNSAIAVALMSHFALYDRRGFIAMREWGNQYAPVFEHFSQPWVGPVKARKTPDDLGVGLNTAWAVHTLLVECNSLKEIMERTIEWGGDTDSVASIAWGIASARYQDEIIPEFLERDLEATGNLKYGPTFLKDLGKRLMDAYA